MAGRRLVQTNFQTREIPLERAVLLWQNEDNKMHRMFHLKIILWGQQLESEG